MANLAEWLSPLERRPTGFELVRVTEADLPRLRPLLDDPAVLDFLAHLDTLVPAQDVTAMSGRELVTAFDLGSRVLDGMAHVEPVPDDGDALDVFWLYLVAVIDLARSIGLPDRFAIARDAVRL